MQDSRSSAGAESCAIGDYALIGDCRSAALISRSGGLDWLCLPHFSSPAIFGALLDRERGGRFQIRPSGPAHETRRYLPGTNVLETTYRTRDGSVRVLDSMSIPCDRELQPSCEVLRLIEGIDGTVPIAVEIDPQPDYGRTSARLQRRGQATWAWTWDDECMHLVTDLDLQSAADAVGWRMCSRRRSAAVVLAHAREARYGCDSKSRHGRANAFR